MRLTTEFWVSAYIRQAQLENDFAVLERRGASSGGAVFVIIDYRNGDFELFGPAPQALLDEGNERAFSKVLGPTSSEKIQEKLEKETRFDPDMWVVTRETFSGSTGLKIAEE